MRAKCEKQSTIFHFIMKLYDETKTSPHDFSYEKGNSGEKHC